MKVIFFLVGCLSTLMHSPTTLNARELSNRSQSFEFDNQILQDIDISNYYACGCGGGGRRDKSEEIPSDDDD